MEAAGRKLLADSYLLAGGGYNLGATGGEANHTLTISEMPAHNHSGHNFMADLGRNSPPQWGSAIENLTSLGASRYAATPASLKSGMQNTGSGSAHNNMPPYLAVSVWKRTT